MADYQKMYTTMFNAATDALNALDRLDIGRAKELLLESGEMGHSESGENGQF